VTILALNDRYGSCVTIHPRARVIVVYIAART